MMFANRRKSERRICRRAVKIQAGAGLPRDCLITDVSAGGVKLVAEHLDVPAEFVVIFGPGDERRCALRWRVGCEIGAEFVD